MNAQLPVLIVGAGPTGLMLACELARRAVDFRIIDKKSGPVATSNATWIQTRTLELLDQAGLVSPFIKAGHQCDGINLYVNGKHLITIPLNHIESSYPYILMLPQSETESILSDRIHEMNKNVERSTELTDVTQDESGVTAVLKNSREQREIVKCRWLIACDGASSTVRERCNVIFPGEDLTEQFMVADAHIDSFMAKNEAHLFFDEGTIFTASPLGSNKYRIAANLHLEHPRRTLYEKEIIELVQERGHGAYYVKDISWISSFWVHGRVVKNMRQGSIFLAGDAAHIHSPAGGQGMNTGMQDAYNLGWKLAMVIQGKARLSLLDSYQEERHPVVNEIVNLTEHFTKLALYDTTFLTKLQKFSAKIMNGDEKTISHTGKIISQTGIRYQSSPVINYEEIVGAKCPGPGERMPDAKVDPKTRLYDFLRHPMHNVLMFTGISSKNSDIKKLAHIQEQLEQKYGDLLRTHVVATDEVRELKNVIHDASGSVHECFHINKPAVYIARPDNYIGYCTTKLNLDSITSFINRYFFIEQ